MQRLDSKLSSLDVKNMKYGRDVVAVLRSYNWLGRGLGDLSEVLPTLDNLSVLIFTECEDASQCSISARSWHDSVHQCCQSRLQLCSQAVNECNTPTSTNKDTSACVMHAAGHD